MEEQRDERMLLTRITRGDHEALKMLFHIYRPRLWNYVLHQLGCNTDRVEDVLQEVFIAIWKHASSFRGDAQVSTWIFRIAHNYAANARADASRQPVTQAIDDEEVSSNTQMTSSTFIDVQILDRIVLINALQRLSDKHRAVLDLVCYQGFSIDEAAEIIGVPSGTVKSRLSYARRSLETILMQAHREEEVENGA